MIFLLEQLLGALRLIGSSATAYITSISLLIIAVVPSAVRSYRLFSRNDNVWLEFLVEVVRVALFGAMVLVGRGWGPQALLDGESCKTLGADVATAFQTGWLGILIQLVLVTAIIVGFDALIAVVGNEHNMSTVLTALRLDVGLAPRLGMP